MIKLTVFCLALFASGAIAQSDKPAEVTSTKTPDLIVSYSHYKYALQGTTTANTNIYRFGNSTVDMQLVTGTWLFSPKWTFVMMVPYIKNMVETIYEPVPGGLNLKTTDYTEGLGDVRLFAISPILVQNGHLLMYDAGFTLPTGSTDAYFTSNPSQRAAYNMQLGSGTPDLVAGLNYRYTMAAWITNARLGGTLRGGKNSHGYALGDEVIMKADSRYQPCPYFDTGVQFNYRWRDKVNGRDERYEIFNHYVGTVPGVAGDGHQFYHAPQINWDATWVAKASTPSWKNIVASLEGGVPLWQGAQNKDDIRLDIKYWFTASVTGTF